MQDFFLDFFVSQPFFTKTKRPSNRMETFFLRSYIIRRLVFTRGDGLYLYIPGGGFKYVLFSPLFVEMIQFDKYFQMG